MSKSVKAMIKMTGSIVLCLVLGLALVGGLVGCGDEESTTTTLETDATEAGGDATEAGGDGATSGSADAGDLVGKWYSAELDETLEFTADGKMTWTRAGEGAPAFDYQVEMGAIVFTQLGAPEDNTLPYTLEGSTLTTEDPEYGTVTYTKQ